MPLLALALACHPEPPPPPPVRPEDSGAPTDSAARPDTEPAPDSAPPTPSAPGLELLWALDVQGIEAPLYAASGLETTLWFVTDEAEIRIVDQTGAVRTIPVPGEGRRVAFARVTPEGSLGPAALLRPSVGALLHEGLCGDHVVAYTRRAEPGLSVAWWSPEGAGWFDLTGDASLPMTLPTCVDGRPWMTLCSDQPVEVAGLSFDTPAGTWRTWLIDIAATASGAPHLETLGDFETRQAWTIPGGGILLRSIAHGLPIGADTPAAGDDVLVQVTPGGAPTVRLALSPVSFAAVRPAGDGSVWLAGATPGPLRLGSLAPYDVGPAGFVARLASSGDLWAQVHEGLDVDGLAVAPRGGAFLFGSSQAALAGLGLPAAPLAPSALYTHLDAAGVARQAGWLPMPAFGWSGVSLQAPAAGAFPAAGWLTIPDGLRVALVREDGTVRTGPDAAVAPGPPAGAAVPLPLSDGGWIVGVDPTHPLVFPDDPWFAAPPTGFGLARVRPTPD